MRKATITKKNTVTRPPSAEEFTKEAVIKAVFKTTAQHPLSLYSTGIGILGWVALAVLGSSSIILGTAIGGTVIGVGSWVFNFFVRGDALGQKYIDSLNEQKAEYKKMIEEKLIEEIEQWRNIPGAEEYVAQAVSQFDDVRGKIQTFRDLLEKKLDSTEMTFTRYYASADEVYFSVLDNLEKASFILESISTIDVGFLEQRLRSLSRIRQLGQADEDEKQTLLERKKLREDKLEEVNQLLTDNEQALTAIEKATTSLTSITRTRAQVDMDTAREQLEELAARAHKYASTRSVHEM